MFRRTKIVATVGPASCSSPMLEALVSAGVNVFRLNFSHQMDVPHEELVRRIRDVAAKLKANVAVLADLQGPKIRIGRFRDGPVSLQAGDLFVLDVAMAEDQGDVHRVHVSYPALVRDCAPGDVLLLDDGLIEVEVLKVVDSAVHCRVLTGGRLSNNKGLNRKGGGLSARALTDKDMADIEAIAGMEVDYLALSFPRDAGDVARARSLYREAGGQGGVVAKMERAEAVMDHQNLDAIIAESDGVMVARGDLAVEIGDAELVGVQKHIIQRARALGRFVITATQMMESMIHSPQPTRAEVSDVANAVLDGTDAVMLSAETAVGEYPEQTVRAMDRIILGAERTYQQRQPPSMQEALAQPDAAIASAAMFMANHLRGVKAIAAMTESGATVRMMSRIRSGMPIFAFTPRPEVQRRLAMYRGVQTVPFDSAALPAERVNDAAITTLLESGVVREGDRVIITKGDFDQPHGGTNTLKVVTVG